MAQHREENYHPILGELSNQMALDQCAQLREALVADVAETGGHLASNLGVVELTVALHRVYDTSRDRLVFDVGHQCYPHKILTGRGDQMATLRQFGGIAGFPKPTESIHDAFIAGHASNSVAVALGMARGRTLTGGDYSVVALIGDGALTGGLAYEGMSNAGQSGESMLVILNDNGMSIAPNVGGVAEHLADQRLRPQYISFKKIYRKIMLWNPVGRGLYHIIHGIKTAIKQSLLPSSMFENMGFTYLGPVDGHDVEGLTRILRFAKDIQGPTLLHVRTTKGKGYDPAEQTPHAFHGVAPFDPQTGESKKSSGDNFSAVFGRTLADLGEERQEVVAITAAMTGGTGMEHFAQRHPDRFFDVGIAEGCAVSMAAGMASQGLTPVFAVYSTFLQRSYDMLLHDVALEGLHVVLAVDRAGLVGDDGETHHGVFDVGYLASVPGMTVLAPASFLELQEMTRRAVCQFSSPVAIRYPRGAEGGYTASGGDAPATCIRQGDAATLVGYGIAINDLLDAADLLAKQNIQVEIIKLNQIAPLDANLVADSVKKTGHLVVVEDCVAAGCVGSGLVAQLAQLGLTPAVTLLNHGDSFTTHGDVKLLKQQLGLTPEQIATRVQEVISHG